jgi:hypothetical protein
MVCQHLKKILFLLFCLFIQPFSVYSAKLTDILVVDQNHLMVVILDGEVTHRDDGIGPNAFTNNYHETDIDTVKTYTPLLNTTVATQTSSWTLTSSDDPGIGTAGVAPSQCYRKTKLNGHAEREWVSNDFRYESTYEHTLYLKFNQPLTSGKTYTLDIASSINADKQSVTFTYDIFQSRSEAIHINLAGYQADQSVKSADLYMWMGDGGARDYKSIEGNKVFVYNINTKQSTEVSAVAFWKAASGNDVGWYNLTRSSVWNADFSTFSTPGTYRIVIEGVGCSQDFTISDKAYYNPFMVSLQGFFYMRIGQDSTAGIKPVPRRPLYIPGVSPASTKVYLTTMTPYHAEWKTFSSGDVWDNPNDWSRFKVSGNPLNNRAYGGHSDALDWDRYLGHVCIIYDMLLPFILTNGAINDDDLDIAESGNNIPDILDEARNEVDFWLRLRDGAGYSHGLTNPNSSNEFYQAGPTTVAAWANAANAAMLAECFRISGLTNLMNEYKDSAIAAYNFANSQTNKMLDNLLPVGDATMKGRDLKATAAAALYNVTGQTIYEDAFNQECAIKTANSIFENTGSGDSLNQLWAAAIYLKTPQAVHYSLLFDNIKSSIIAQSKSKEVSESEKRPSRRSSLANMGYFRTAQNVHHTIIAHAVSDNETDRQTFRKALNLEYDYGLGRNPMNMIQMTTASTPLEKMRSVYNAYTTGHDDGVYGLHPGHTPYFNLDDWDQSMTMGSPSKLFANCYPSDFQTTWPIDEGYFNTRYVWAHNEFTPQQTMRGKMALYGYLYGITKQGGSPIKQQFRSYNIKLKNSALSKVNYIAVVNASGRIIWRGSGGQFVDYKSSPNRASGLVFIEYYDNNSVVAKKPMLLF